MTRIALVFLPALGYHPTCFKCVRLLVDGRVFYFVHLIRSHRVFEGLLLPQLTLFKYRVWTLRSFINFTLLHKTVCLLKTYHTTMRTQRLATTLP